MIGIDEAKALINGLFEEEALTLGGLVFIYDIDDDVIWSLIQSYDSIRRRAIKRLDNLLDEKSPLSPEKPLNLSPHPAIEDFLERVRA